VSRGAPTGSHSTRGGAKREKVRKYLEGRKGRKRDGILKPEEKTHSSRKGEARVGSSERPSASSERYVNRLVVLMVRDGLMKASGQA